MPFPPALNSYYRNVNGVMKISAKGREYTKAVADQVLIQRGAKHLTGRLSVSLLAYVPDKRKRDLDGMFKALLDSLTKAGVWEDDEQIDALQIIRMPVGGMMKVSISEILKS